MVMGYALLRCCPAASDADVYLGIQHSVQQGLLSKCLVPVYQQQPYAMHHPTLEPTLLTDCNARVAERTLTLTRLRTRQHWGCCSDL